MKSGPWTGGSRVELAAKTLVCLSCIQVGWAVVLNRDASPSAFVVGLTSLSHLMVGVQLVRLESRVWSIVLALMGLVLLTTAAVGHSITEGPGGLSRVTLALGGALEVALGALAWTPGTRAVDRARGTEAGLVLGAELVAWISALWLVRGRLGVDASDPFMPYAVPWDRLDAVGGMALFVLLVLSILPRALLLAPAAARPPRPRSWLGHAMVTTGAGTLLWLASAGAPERAARPPPSGPFARPSPIRRPSLSPTPSPSPSRIPLEARVGFAPLAPPSRRASSPAEQATVVQLLEQQLSSIEVRDGGPDAPRVVVVEREGPTASLVWSLSVPLGFLPWAGFKDNVLVIHAYGQVTHWCKSLGDFWESGGRIHAAVRPGGVTFTISAPPELIASLSQRFADRFAVLQDPTSDELRYVPTDLRQVTPREDPARPLDRAGVSAIVEGVLLGHPAVEAAYRLESLTRPQLLDRARGVFQPANLTVTLVGPPTAAAHIERLSHLRDRERSTDSLDRRRLRRSEDLGSAHPAYVLAYPLELRSPGDAAAMALAARVLVERLHERLPLEKQDAWVENLLGVDELIIATTAPARVGPATPGPDWIFFDEIERWRTAPPEPERLDRARTRVLEDLLARVEDAELFAEALTSRVSVPELSRGVPTQLARMNPDAVHGALLRSLDTATSTWVRLVPPGPSGGRVGH